MITALWNKENPKATYATEIERKTHHFETLIECAEFIRSHNVLTYAQRDNKKAPKNKETGDKLYIGSHMLQIDLDTDMDYEDLAQRFIKHKFKGFFFATTALYERRERRARIFIVTKDIIPLDYQTKFYAQQVLVKMGYGNEVIKKIDGHAYNTSAYFAKVWDKVDGKWVVPDNYDKYGKSLYVFDDGDPFEWTSQSEYQIKIAKTKNKHKKSTIRNAAQYGKLGDLAVEMLSYKHVESTTARDNGTVSLTFHNIKERTKGGYFINPTSNPWLLSHPNHEKTVKYMNKILGKKDFACYRKFIKKFDKENPLTERQKPDLVLPEGQQYLNPGIFDHPHPFIVIESGTNTGKTTQIAEYLKNNSDTVLIISVNRTQAILTYNYLQQRDIDFEKYIQHIGEPGARLTRDGYVESKYVQDARKGIAPDRLICNILSLHHLFQKRKLIKTYQSIIIDEITTLPSSAINTVDLVMEHENRFYDDLYVLGLLLRKAEKIIVTDGFVSNSVIKAISKISKKRPFFIKNPYQTKKRVDIFVSDSRTQPNFQNPNDVTCKQFMTLLNKDLSVPIPEGRLIPIACSLKDQAEQLKSYININYPDKKVLIITADIEKEDNKSIVELTTNLTHHLKRDKIDVLIYSPTIITAIDIPEAKGMNVYHIMNENGLTSHSHYQMTMRGRNANRYRVLIPKLLFTKKPSSPPEEQIQSGLFNIYETLKFRGTNPHDLVHYCIKKENLAMGSALLWLWLNKLDKSTLPRRTFKNSLKNHTLIPNLLPSLNIPVLNTAIQLELAFIDYRNYDRQHSTAQQYINILNYEGCKVTVREDITQKQYKYEKSDYSKQYKHKIRKILNYKGKLNGNSQNYLNNYQKQLSTSQRIIHTYKTKYKHAPTKTKTTVKVLRSIFKLYGFTFTTPKHILTREQCIEIYETLSNQLLELEKNISTLFPPYITSNNVKFRRVFKLLSLFFIVKNHQKSLKININMKLLRSIRKPRKVHLDALYMINHRKL